MTEAFLYPRRNRITKILSLKIPLLKTRNISLINHINQPNFDSMTLKEFMKIYKKLSLDELKNILYLTTEDIAIEFEAWKEEIETKHKKLND